MVEEDLEETETRTYTFSTWKKQVAVGAEGFEDLVESVLGLENKYNAHEKNTQIHTSQAEKDTWNAKAVIKGLESGKVQMKPNNFDANSLVENSIFYFRVIDVSLSNMPNIGYWRLEHYVQGDVYFQKAIRDYVCNEYVRYKYRFNDSAWTTWKLIAQDQAPINTHMSDTVKHVTQANKDNWNGKATIKGLESGFAEINPPIANNADDIKYNSVYYVYTMSKNGYPVANSYGYLETQIRTDLGGQLQIFREFLTNKIFQRFENNGWQPWQLMSAPKMFATGYIDSVTFNGTVPVIKSVLFDDGVTRSMAFYKTASLGVSYYYTNNNGGYNIVSITAGDLMSYSVIGSNAGYMFFLGGSSPSNNPYFADSSFLKVDRIIITIKL